MAGAIIIACAIGVLLLVIAGSVIVGGTLASGISIVSAQKDMALQKELQIGDSVLIPYADTYWDGSYYTTEFLIKNNGNVAVTNFSKIDIMVQYAAPNDNPKRRSPGSGLDLNTWYIGTIYGNDNWNPEVINPNQWDPGECIFGWFHGTTTTPSNIQVVTQNGATAFAVPT